MSIQTAAGGLPRYDLFHELSRRFEANAREFGTVIHMTEPTMDVPALAATVAAQIVEKWLTETYLPAIEQEAAALALGRVDLDTLRKAHAIGAISHAGDGFFAADAGYGYDDAEATMAAASAILEALPAAEAPGLREAADRDGKTLVDWAIGHFEVNDDPCQFDHHGGCQQHGYLDLEPGEACPAGLARDAAARLAKERDR